MKDFTLQIYGKMLESAISAGYHLISFESFVDGVDADKVFILRHDVDKLPQNSLDTAVLQKSLGVKGTYYFRIVPESNQPEYIEKIAALGHEIGYHYEEMSLCGGNREKAMEMFEENLAYFRKFYPVRTICMHGSPTSNVDNRSIWRDREYLNHGVIAEPYFDVDFSDMLYLTDTGRSWGRDGSSVRDRVDGIKHDFSSTEQIIKAFNSGAVHPKVMHNIHPQRWTDDMGLWYKELVLQNLKNPIKKLVKAIR